MKTTTPRQENRQRDALSTLTPSEQVLLNGAQFAPQPGRPGQKEKLLTGDATVSARHLAEAALAAALLANEKAEALRLRTERRSSLFGLLKRTATVVEGLPASPGWAEGTLEASIVRLLAGKPVGLNELLYELLEEKDPSPARHTLDLVKRGLAARGLLDRTEKKLLKVLSAGWAYDLAPGTADLAAQHPANDVRDLIDRCRSERPDLWKGLCSEITRAFSRRTEHSDGPGWSD